MLQAAICKHLADQDLGVFGTAGTDLFVEDLPAEPVAAAAVYSKTAPNGDLSENKISGLQIVVRRPNTGTGKARNGYEAAIAIRDALHGLRHITLDEDGDDETRVVWIRSDGDEPTNLGDDANGCPRWSLRFLAQTVTVTAHTIL